MTSIELKEQLENLDLENILGIFILDDSDDFKCKDFIISISETFYKEHKNIIDLFVKKICSYKRQLIKCLYFSSFDLTKKYMNILKDNDSLEHLTLHNFKLKKEDFNILKQNKTLQTIDSSNISEELKDCYDKRIGFIMKRKITKYKNVEDILFDENLNFFEELTKEQIDLLCFYLTKRKIKGNLNFSHMNNGRLIKKVIDIFDNISNDSEEESSITIEIKNKCLFDYQSFNDFEQNKRINVITETDEPVDMNTYINVEKILQEIMSNFKKYENKLSPFEKLIWLYYIVETYREYKKESTKKDWKESRFINKFLFSDKLVCVGFSSLLSELSKRSSINVWENPAIIYSKDKTKKYNHINNLTFIEDEKYNIKGLYLLDACHDNHKYKDLFVFNHFLITPEEYENHIMNIFSAGYSLLAIKDKEQFLKIIKSDTYSLESLIKILTIYYKNHKLFNYHFNNYDDFIEYYYLNAEQLYDLAKNIIIEPISEDKVKKALINIERLINPTIEENELLERLNKIFEIYQKRHNDIYNSKRTEKGTKK